MTELTMMIKVQTWLNNTILIMMLIGIEKAVLHKINRGLSAMELLINRYTLIIIKPVKMTGFILQYAA